MTKRSELVYQVAVASSDVLLAQDELDRAKKALEAFDSPDKAPPGTVYELRNAWDQICGGTLIAVKVRNARQETIPDGWRTLFDDFSGEIYPSFDALKRNYAYTGGKWVEVRRGPGA